MPIMINIIIFNIIFLDVYPALANAIIVIVNTDINKENIIQMFQVLTNVSTTFNVPIKRRFLIIGMTIIVITLIFAFDSLIEYWFGVSKEKITDHNSVFNRN